MSTELLRVTFIISCVKFTSKVVVFSVSRLKSLFICSFFAWLRLVDIAKIIANEFMTTYVDSLCLVDVAIYFRERRKLILLDW